MQRHRLIVMAMLALGVASCSTDKNFYEPYLSFEERLEQQEKNGVKVKAAALGREESAAVFGVPLNDVGVQPIFLHVSNSLSTPHLLFPIASDPDYFPPYEVARRASTLLSSSRTTEEIYDDLAAKLISHTILPGSTHEGFLFTHSDEGMKAFVVEIQGVGTTNQFHFVVLVPGFPSDYFAIDTELLNSHSEVPDLDEDQLQTWLQQVPCCTHNNQGKSGDPINIAFVGTLEQVREALIGRHWDVTAPVTQASLRALVSAFLFGSRYRYAPISSLYVMDREHDLAFQKARSIIDERIHLRLWLASVQHQGRPVWIGQISRDIGVKLSGKFWPPTTHVIDPDVDDARFYLLQDIMDGEQVAKFGYTTGVTPSTVFEPAFNAENDPYFTDGLRIVFILVQDGETAPNARLLQWAYPAKLQPFAEALFGAKAK